MLEGREAAALLRLSEEEVRARALEYGYNLSYCRDVHECVGELLTLLNVLEVSVEVGQPGAPPGALGVVFGRDLEVAKVHTSTPPLLGERHGLGALIGGWRLESIGGHDVKYSRLAERYTAMTGTFSMVFKRIVVAKKLVRESPTQNFGVKLAERTTIIENIEAHSPGEHSGLSGYVGWKVCTIEGQRVSDAADLVNRSHLKNFVKLGLVQPHCRRMLSVDKGADERLGVSFADDTLAVKDVVKGGVADRCGFSDYVGGWRVAAVHNKKIVENGDLVTYFGRYSRTEKGKPRAVTFVLAPVVCENVLSAQEAPDGDEAGGAAGASEPHTSREVVLTRKAADEPTGVICTENLIVEQVKLYSSGAKAGLSGLVGWRMTAIDGKPVSCRETLKKEIVGKLRFAVTLELDDANLPSNIVEMHLNGDLTQKEVLQGVARFGEVQEVLPPVEVREINCLGCGTLVGVRTKFCASCGAKVINTMPPFLCHISFQQVEAAQRMLSNPPSHLQHFLKVKYYHPPMASRAAQQQDDEKLVSDAARPSILTMINCLGFFNAWAILNVGRDATKDEIKKSWKEKSLLYHPDRQHSNPATADMSEKEKEKILSGEMMKTVTEAYKSLTDETRREKLEADVEKAIVQSGRKQVMARIPTRTKAGDFALGGGGGGKAADSDDEDRDHFGEATAAAPVSNSLFAAYTTSTATEQEPAYKRKTAMPGVSQRTRAYGGLQQVEIVEKEYNPHQVHDQKSAAAPVVAPQAGSWRQRNEATRQKYVWWADALLGRTHLARTRARTHPQVSQPRLL